MFNWLATIFTIISLIVLFIAWSRTLNLKHHLKGAQEQQNWKIFRILVFVTFAYQIVLIIFAIIGMERTYAWLGAIFIMLFSVDVYYAVSLFIPVLQRQKVEEPPAPQAE